MDLLSHRFRICPPPTAWSNEDKAKVVEMFTQGYSMGKIAESLPGSRTRSSIAGLLKRLRQTVCLESRVLGRPRKHDPKKRATRKPFQMQMPKRAFVIVAPVKKHRMRLKLIDNPIAVTFAELQVGHCKFPLGDPRQSDFRFCGASRLDGKPYCQKHAEMAFRCYEVPIRRLGVRLYSR